jgi:hypothetical protein
MIACTFHSICGSPPWCQTHNRDAVECLRALEAERDAARADTERAQELFTDACDRLDQSRARIEELERERDAAHSWFYYKHVARRWKSLAGKLRRQDAAHERDNVALIGLCKRSRSEAARLREVLRKVEWGGWDTLAGPECPDCGGAKSLGHDPSCRLAAALKEGEK